MTHEDVRVAFVSLDVSAERLRALSSLLSPDERARAERFAFERHRRRFTAARGQLRETLGAALAMSPEAIRFEQGPNGKPRLAQDKDGAWRFNVSHSDERAAFAIARGLELGVDLEALRSDIDHAAIAARFFAPAERDALLALPEHERAAGFFEIWTRKEAFVKLLGDGLTIPLASFVVSLGRNARLLAGGEAAKARFAAPVELRSLEAPPGFVAALAVAGRPSGVL